MKFVHLWPGDGIVIFAALPAMTELRYTVSLLHTDEGLSVWVPGLPGCASQGQTETEALDNIRDAIHEYLAVAEQVTGSAEKREVVLQR